MVNTLTNAAPYTPFERKWIARIVFLLIFCSLVYSFLAGTLLHQLQQPVIRFPYVDLTYWLFHSLQIPEFITGNAVVAGLFDLLLFLSCLLVIVYPDRRLFIWVFAVLYFIYFIIYNTFGAHHTANKIGILLIPVAFAVRNITSFNYLWQGLRYMLLFAMSSAFAYKFFRLNWLHPNQGILILKKNRVPQLYFHPSSFYGWLLEHPQLVNALFMAGFLLEGCFIIGFFTKKFDRWLLLALLALVIGFRLMADAHFFELLIWGLTLVNFHRLIYFTKNRKMGETTPVNRQANTDTTML